MENFIEYMWYLLTTPFKQVKKQVNMWYTWCKVIGLRFDIVKADFYRARNEGMLASCSHEMLAIHGADRNLSRYEGESLESFRKRIAMYAEVCMLGGTPEGILLAVKTLGYSNVQLIPAREFYNDSKRWAEFVVLLDLNTNENNVSLEALKQTVREWKEVGALDNYQFYFRISETTVALENIFRIILRDTLEPISEELPRMILRVDVKTEFTHDVVMGITNAWYLDGTYTLNGRIMSVGDNYKEDLNE